MKKINCVLLVDDDEATNYVNKMLLEDMEVAHRVLVANNGREALALIKQECEVQCCPTLILLDINMPVMNGFEFMEAYHELEVAHQQSVVVVMLTTSLNPTDVDQLQQFPINGLLNKPLTEENVHAILEQHFNLNIS